MPSEIAERFSSYSLTGLIPEHEQMVLDHELRILTQLQIAREACTIIEQQQFTIQEWELLCALIEHFPYYCPFASLLSVHERKSLERCQRQVNRALADGTFNALVQPVRNVLSRVRIKLHNFGIEIKSMIETGYMLLRDEQHIATKKGKW